MQTESCRFFMNINGSKTSCLRSNKSFRVNLHSKKPPGSIGGKITANYFTIRSFFTDLTPGTLFAS